MPTVDPGIRARSNVEKACRITRRLIAANPLKRDHSGEYEALQAWPFVTALYSGMEQALKLLLLMPEDSKFTLKKLKDREYGHNLTRLHAELPREDREHIELHFAEHWSLYEFGQFAPEIEPAQDFIGHINGRAQEGSLMWRYNLLDPAVEKPSTNLWTMSEIWHAACCRIKARALDRQNG